MGKCKGVLRVTFMPYATYTLRFRKPSTLALAADLSTAMSKTPTVTPSRKRPLSREPSPPKYQEDFGKVSLRHDISSLDSDYTMKDPALLRKLLLRIVPKMRAEENEVLTGELERTCDQAESMHEPTVINLGTEQGLLATMVRMSDAMVRALAISVIKLRRPDSKFAAPDGSQVR